MWALFNKSVLCVNGFRKKFSDPNRIYFLVNLMAEIFILSSKMTTPQKTTGSLAHVSELILGESPSRYKLSLDSNI